MQSLKTVDDDWVDEDLMLPVPTLEVLSGRCRIVSVYVNFAMALPIGAGKTSYASGAIAAALLVFSPTAEQLKAVGLDEPRRAQPPRNGQGALFYFLTLISLLTRVTPSTPVATTTARSICFWLSTKPLS